MLTFRVVCCRSAQNGCLRCVPRGVCIEYVELYTYCVIILHWGNYVTSQCIVSDSQKVQLKISQRGGCWISCYIFLIKVQITYPLFTVLQLSSQGRGYFLSCKTVRLTMDMYFVLWYYASKVLWHQQLKFNHTDSTTDVCITYALHYNLGFVPTFWRPKTFLQGGFSRKFCLYVWLVFMRGF